jgi:hypothetical protein
VARNAKFFPNFAPFSSQRTGRAEHNDRTKLEGTVGKQTVLDDDDIGLYTRIKVPDPHLFYADPDPARKS